MNHGRSLDRIDGWWSKPPQDLGQRALVGRQKDPVEGKRRARFVPLPVSLDNADAFIDALTQEGSFEGLPPFAARACPDVLQPRASILVAFAAIASHVILSEVARAFGFARSAGARTEGLPGRRLVEPGRSEESLFDVN